MKEEREKERGREREGKGKRGMRERGESYVRGLLIKASPS